MSELEGIRAKAYENSTMHKEIAKLFHGRHTHRKEFFLGPKVLLYDSKLHFFRPIEILLDWSFHYFSCFFTWCYIDTGPMRDMHFKKNGERLKSFMELTCKGERSRVFDALQTTI